ncbi:hypothetical protein Bca52824_005742 [Brassica carinata]|uniref:Sulfotransferase n=1 Tax=Brassica carinata TaxID=52824 RepID=A0A8X7WS22_BRACI|nr:hypothetical protein Bca52824_005742 [Brassica carinata]
MIRNMDHNELPMNLRDKISEETKKLISSLPTDKDYRGNLCKYQGCWYYYNTLQAVINFQKHFQPQETDSGTTWLKALTVALLERSKHVDDDDPLNHHPLLSDNPHGIVPFFENNLNAKDALISLWYFRCKYQKLEVTRSVLESMFESLCRGVNFYGPIWDHVLSYWRGSLEDPSRVLFMKYEEMKEEPYAQLTRLAEFLGCPFTEEEEERGVLAT